ncbi:DUF4279 domain-containing protein [Paenibacillus chitinolyticus]|uniref:DUF4279 domain-containing protein n=1 Tax=Paenibacillus chitinolyticus TaxID=79263 RepID=UPI003CFF6018
MCTTVSAEFLIVGDTFNPNKVSSILKIKPTGYYVKGEKVTGRNLIRKETCWFLKTECEKSLDINDQLSKIIKPLIGIKKELIELKKQMVIDYKFFIVIKIEENQVPAMYLLSEVIEFIGHIQAEFEFDVYVQ